jgi:excisionase family DNA binding protein
MNNPAFIPEGNYYTKSQAAQVCKVNLARVQQWIARGQLPALQIQGMGYLIREDDLTAFLALDRPRGYPKGKPRKT